MEEKNIMISILRAAEMLWPDVDRLGVEVKCRRDLRDEEDFLTVATVNKGHEPHIMAESEGADAVHALKGLMQSLIGEAEWRKAKAASSVEDNDVLAKKLREIAKGV